MRGCVHLKIMVADLISKNIYPLYAGIRTSVNEPTNDCGSLQRPTSVRIIVNWFNRPRRGGATNAARWCRNFPFAQAPTVIGRRRLACRIEGTRGLEIDFFPIVLTHVGDPHVTGIPIKARAEWVS